MENEWLNQLKEWYDDDKYIEINFGELVERCGNSEALTWEWLRNSDMKFLFKPYLVGKGDKRRRAQGFDNIAFSKHLKYAGYAE